VVLGSFALAAIVISIVVVALAAALGMPWIITILGFIFQTVFYVFSPLIQVIVGRGREERQMEPGINYVLRTADGRLRTFRIKGRLQGATIGEGDRVRVWGRPQNGILRFQGGVKLDIGETLSLPVRWGGWLFLALVVAANLYFYFSLSGQHLIGR